MSSLPAEQRLLNLIIALSSTRRRLTREQIRTSVEGYDPPAPGDEYHRLREDRAFERKFERDKDELRRLGIPLQTVTDPVHGNEIGYRIDPGDATLPDLRLSAAELAVLSLAVEYWQDAALGADARHGFTKVASAADPGPRIELPFGGRTTTSQAATGVLIEAITERQVVRFEYASAASGTQRRTVEPWRVIIRGGIEYLVGYDRERQDQRVYRIGRINGGVTRVGEPGAFTPPAQIPATSLDDSAPERTARVAVRPESAHALRARGTAAGQDGVWDLLDVPYRHADALQAEVLALAGAARVVEPQELADAVAASARRASEIARVTPASVQTEPGEGSHG